MNEPEKTEPEEIEDTEEDTELDEALTFMIRVAFGVFIGITIYRVFELVIIGILYLTLK